MISLRGASHGKIYNYSITTVNQISIYGFITYFLITTITTSVKQESRAVFIDPTSFDD